MSPKKIGVLVLVAVLGLLLVDRLHITPEEEVQLHMAAVGAALADEDLAGLKALFSPSVRVDGPPPIRRGVGDETWQRAEEWFSDADDIVLEWSLGEVVIQGSVARADTRGRVRFRWGDMLIMYRLEAVVGLRNKAESWEIQTVEVTLLRRGI